METTVCKQKEISNGNRRLTPEPFPGHMVHQYPIKPSVVSHPEALCRNTVRVLRNAQSNRISRYMRSFQSSATSLCFRYNGSEWYGGSAPVYRLIGLTRPIMWLTDHCWISVGRSVLLSRVKSRVQDAVGIIGSIWESHRRRAWTSHWRRAYRVAHRSTGTIAAAWWPILILAPGGLSLEAISREACKRSHKSHLAIF